MVEAGMLSLQCNFPGWSQTSKITRFALMNINFVRHCDITDIPGRIWELWYHLNDKNDHFDISLWNMITFSNIMDHFNNHNILTEAQHGFQPGRSCERDTVDIKSRGPSQIHWSPWAGRWNIVLDFSKAFDRVPHQKFCGNINITALQDPYSSGLNISWPYANNRQSSMAKPLTGNELHQEVPREQF